MFHHSLVLSAIFLLPNKKGYKMNKTLLSFTVIAALSIGANAMEKCAQGKYGGDTKKEMKTAMTKSYYKLNDKGELIRPTDYRTWVYIGTPVTPNDLNGGHAAFPEMHNVYIDPESYKVYKETGKFREGTIIVKELVSVGATQAVSGKGYFEGEFLGLEASVKSKKDFPKEPGNWAIFTFSDMKTGILKDSAPVMPSDKCVSCHQASASDDFVFTQYYPVLRAAKGFGKGNPEDTAKRAIQKMKK